MPVPTHRERKNILADPVRHFTNARPNITDEQLSVIKDLALQHAELKHQLEACRNHCKKISRQIGEAKRAQQPIDELMHNMQKNSLELQTLEQRVSEVSDNILSLFEPANPVRDDDEPSCEPPGVRANDSQHIKNDQLTISLLQEEDEAWNSYVESNPAASIYHRAEWKYLIHDVFGHDSYYLYAHDAKHNIFGVLPLVRLKSRLFGDFMVSMPYFNYGGAIADSRSVEDILMHHANDLAGNLGISHIEYRDETARSDYPVKTEKVNMVLSLPNTHDELWNGFTSKLRSQIRRPLREKARTLCGGEELLDGFYTVFTRNMRDLGTPVYSRSFFQHILNAFPKQSRIIIVHLQSRPVAAAFLLGYRDTLQIPWASTIKDVNHLSINMLLYWEVLKFAIDTGYNHFDFGRSSKDSGTFRFKQQWGAKPKQLFWHYWLASGTDLPKLNPDNPKYVMAINIWKRLPISITKLLGPYIVKNLP